jgi:hypothetical protein
MGCDARSSNLPEHDVPALSAATLETRDIGGSAPSARCSLEHLEASYLDEEGPSLGRIRVGIQGDYDGGGEVEVAVAGAVPITAPLTSLADGLTEAHIQDGSSVDGELSVRVRVSLDCGLEVAMTFAFEDPLKRCEVATAEPEPGHEGAFYSCAERWLECGERGYLVGYGELYAERFVRNARPRMTERGQAWVDDVLVCLQTELREDAALGMTCRELRRTAFNEHPHCYASSGFCRLQARDLAVVISTIAPRDLLSRDGLRQLIAIAPECKEALREASPAGLTP